MPVKWISHLICMKISWCKNFLAFHCISHPHHQQFEATMQSSCFKHRVIKQCSQFSGQSPKSFLLVFHRMRGMDYLWYFSCIILITGQTVCEACYRLWPVTIIMLITDHVNISLSTIFTYMQLARKGILAAFHQNFVSETTSWCTGNLTMWRSARLTEYIVTAVWLYFHNSLVVFCMYNLYTF